jgi:hypothetical protein
MYSKTNGTLLAAPRIPLTPAVLVRLPGAPTIYLYPPSLGPAGVRTGRVTGELERLGLSSIVYPEPRVTAPTPRLGFHESPSLGIKLSSSPSLGPEPSLGTESVPPATGAAEPRAVSAFAVACTDRQSDTSDIIVTLRVGVPYTPFGPTRKYRRVYVLVLAL